MRLGTDWIQNTPFRQIGTDSFLGEATTLGDKALVKRSVIGRSCQIGAGVKITNSVLMDNIRVADGVSIQGTIVCSNSTIGATAELKDCIVGFSQDNLTGTCPGLFGMFQQQQLVCSIYISIIDNF